MKKEIVQEAKSINIKNFIGDTRNHEELVKRVLITFESHGCNGNIKMQCLFSLIDFQTISDKCVTTSRTGNGQKSFAYRGASRWNSLDLDTKMAPSINAFKSKSKLKEKQTFYIWRCIAINLYIFNFDAFHSFYCKFCSI